MANPSNKLTAAARYTTSKLCNLLFAYELDRYLRKNKRNISVNSFDPGFSPGTNLMKDAPAIRKFIMGTRLIKTLMNVAGIVTSNPERSGKALARLLLDPDLHGVSGKYYQIDHPIDSSPDSMNRDFAQELWDGSNKMVGM